MKAKHTTYKPAADEQRRIARVIEARMGEAAIGISHPATQSGTNVLAAMLGQRPAEHPKTIITDRPAQFLEVVPSSI